MKILRTALMSMVSISAAANAASKITQTKVWVPINYKTFGCFYSQPGPVSRDGESGISAMGSYINLKIPGVFSKERQFSGASELCSYEYDIRKNAEEQPEPHQGMLEVVITVVDKRTDWGHCETTIEVLSSAHYPWHTFTEHMCPENVMMNPIQGEIQ